MSEERMIYIYTYGLQSNNREAVFGVESPYLLRTGRTPSLEPEAGRAVSNGNRVAQSASLALTGEPSPENEYGTEKPRNTGYVR